MARRFDFKARVYQAVKKIPAGRIKTYQEIAHAIDRPRAARAVGNVLNLNPDLLNIPCHRVVRSNGEVGGYVRGRAAKEKLLKQEGIKIKNHKIITCWKQ